MYVTHGSVMHPTLLAAWPHDSLPYTVNDKKS